MLYTLSLFILEPPSWCARFEWREFSQMEICAIATHWKSIGESLGIKYTGYLKRTDWRDGIEFYEDIKQWSQEYEEKQMIPTEDNKKLADALIPLLLFWTPYFMRASATKLIAVLMGARLRNAMMCASLTWVSTNANYVKGILNPLSSITTSQISSSVYVASFFAIYVSLGLHLWLPGKSSMSQTLRPGDTSGAPGYHIHFT
jgi:hypothetical protein